jgi:predicted SnoaL-like aldol condensation-catalyzing enzyme
MCNHKQSAVALLQSLETGDPGPAEVLSSVKFIQHNPDAVDGPPGPEKFFKRVTPGTVKVNTVRAFQDGDFVFAHTEYDWFGPRTGFDIFRFAGEKIVEHWDNWQERPKSPNPSGRTMTDGPTEAKNIGKTEANKQLVRGYVEDTFIKGHLDKFAGYFAGEKYLQHNPRRGDGAATLGDSLKAMAAQGAPLKFDQIHKILGEGDFVLAVSEGTFGGKHLCFYDLYRVEDGKIAEHWDVVQTIPEKDRWKNAHGKF